MATQYTEEFKRDAVRYWKEHPELGINKCAKNLGVSKSALSTWGKAYDKNEGTVPTRGRGNSCTHWSADTMSVMPTLAESAYFSL